MVAMPSELFGLHMDITMLCANDVITHEEHEAFLDVLDQVLDRLNR